MNEQIQKPEILTENHLLFLDNLRESEVMYMFEAGPYLREKFPNLTVKESYSIVTYWMRTFSDRHN